MKRKRERGSESGGRSSRKHGEGHSSVMREVSDQLPHLLEGVALHQDVVLGQQKGCDLAELPD